MDNNQQNSFIQNMEATLNSIMNLDFPGMDSEAKKELRKLLEANGAIKNFEELKTQMAEMKKRT